MNTWTPVIIAHTAAAGFSLFAGIIMFSRRKGTPSHRLLGKLWVGTLLFTAISAFWIQSSGHFSWIHILSVYTPIAIVRSVLAARRGQIRAHQIGMTSLFIGSLLIAGAFTLLPGRLLGDALWSSLALAGR